VAIPSGTKLGSYEVVAQIGAGGMGEVYQAHDTKLGRDVAIKVLPEAFAHDAERLARFQREAKILAQLNHANIATIYGLEHSNDSHYLVMELVPGDTLQQRVKRDGPVPVEETLLIAKQIAEALEAAHEKGIIHRDLKPANVKVTPDGKVKVLDFGLAKAFADDGATEDPSNSPTLSMAATMPGMILGTAAYMSPEQARGKAVDKRTDIWAFGCVLFELLTGRQVFRGESFSDTIAAILEREPYWNVLPPSTPPKIRDLLQRSLQKDAQRRLRDLGDARIEIEEVLASKEARGRYERTSGAGTATEAIDLGLAAGSKSLPSIAVLPFVFLGQLEERNAFSLGFADALITILGSLEDVVVLPTSAILNCAPGGNPAQVCRDLEVRHTLQGNVQKLGTQWRVSIQIFDAMTQKVTFSEKYDFRLENVFDVQDEIGRRVVESLRSRFLISARKTRDRYSSDPEAYDEFMSGLRESYSDRPETLQSGIEHLSHAIERDPEFALAHATLSYVSMNMHYSFDPQRTWLERAERHCRQALMLDPALPEGHLAQAWILWSPAKNFQHADAIAALEQVLAARPNFERAHNRMATICLHIGRLQDALVAHEQAQRSNRKTRGLNLEIFYLYSGDFARAEEAAEAFIRERPGTTYALVYHPQPPLLCGDLELAEQRLAVALKQLPDEPMIVSLQGMLHARRHQTGSAIDCVRKALDSPRSFGHTHHTYYQIACVYAVLGETDKAMAWLERSVDTGFACWPFFQVDPHLESLREEPEFKRLVGDLERKYASLKIQRL
jgi:TolB-like protein/Tfp pilus assembly protein PilF